VTRSDRIVPEIGIEGGL